MKIHAFICTRSEELGETTQRLTQYLSRAKVGVKLLVNKSSIFEAYQEAMEKVEPADEDIVIFCHDDVEVISDIEIFTHALITGLSSPKSGFVGVAGTTNLGTNATWWDQPKRASGLHRGFCFQGKNIYDCYSNSFGPPGPVVALDGLFLAAKAKTIREIGLEKPEYFKGEWDFYDIHYTAKAWNMGFVNYVVPIIVLHNSEGQPRTEWHLNRTAFIENNPTLPLTCPKP